MKPRVVIRYVGALLLILGIAMGTSLIIALIYNESDQFASFGLSSAITMFVGFILYLGRQRNETGVSRRDAFAIVAVAWLATSIFGGMPYLLSGALMSPIDAFFESTSGFTTTGSSVFGHPEGLSHTVLYWRALTQWLGGMGIIVLFVAVFAELGVGGRFLFMNEVPGPITESLRPKIRETSLLLWYIYLGLSVLQVVALVLADMSLFSAVCHSMTTMSTGGFSTRDMSVAAFNSPAVTWIIIVFMVIAGVNFSLYFQAFTGNPLALIRDRETWVYLMVLVGSSLVVAINLLGQESNLGMALEKATFQVVSLMTTTGFVSDNFDLYPSMSKILLVILMFIGGCAGSTAGGIKIIRLIIMFKVMHRGVYMLVRPHAVLPVRIGRQVIPDSSVYEISGFLFLYLLVFVVTTLFVAAHGLDMATSLTSVAATLGNIGPGLARVGAIENFGQMPWDVKLVLSLAMILGRLEMYAVVALILPVFWRR